jgi:flagellar biogenesis protein FliO
MSKTQIIILVVGCTVYIALMITLIYVLERFWRSK